MGSSQCIYMEDIVSEKIITNKNLPNFAYAGFFLRLLAFVIDTIIISGLVNIIKSFTGDDFEIFYSISLYLLIYYLVSLGYFSLMTYFNKGQTLGKMITNIRVINLYGEKLTFSQVLTREVFGRFVQNKFMFLYIIVAFAPMHQSLMDILADTVVIKNDVKTFIDSREENLVIAIN